MADVDVGKLLEDVERKRNVKKVLANPVQVRPMQMRQPDEIVIRFNGKTLERLGYWIVIIALATLVFYNPFKDSAASITGNAVADVPATNAPAPVTSTPPAPDQTSTPTTTSSTPAPTPSAPTPPAPTAITPSTATGGVDLEIIEIVSEAKSYGSKLTGITVRIKNNGEEFIPVLVVNVWTNSFTNYKETPRKVFKQLTKQDYYEFDKALASGASIPSFTIQFDFVPVQSGEDANVKVSLYRDSFDVENPTQNLIKSTTKKKRY